MLYFPLLIPLDTVRTHRILQDTVAEHRFDDLLLDLIGEASTEFQEAIERTPMPYQQTRAQDWCAPDWLPLDEDLLAAATVTNGDGTVIAASDYLLDPANTYPKRELLIKRSASVALTYDGEPSQAISLAGTWGYVTHYPSCWKTRTTLGAAVATTTGLSATLTSVTGISVGHYLKVDSEVLGYVTAIDTPTKVVTLDARGALGTTAATHLNGADVATFEQRPDIAGTVRAVAVYKWLHKDEIGGRVTVIAGGVVTVQDLDASVQQTIERCRRTYWLAV